MRSVISQLSLHKLEVFCMVAELESVSRAAERLGLAQPVVSAHIKAMSEKLGTPLTQRNGRRITLTEEGRRVLKWAQEVTVRTRELERELVESKSGLRGTASVGASMTIGSFILPGMISTFRKRHPGAQISVHVASPASVMEAVQSGGCDFAFTILDPRHDLAGVQIERLRDEKLMLVAAESSDISGNRIAPGDLSKHWFVTAQTGTPRRELEEAALRSHGVSRGRIAMEFGHAEAIKQAVRAGAGLAFLFESSVRDELASGLLREIETPGMSLAVPAYLVRREGKRLNQYQTRLMEELTAAMRSGDMT
ncbi:LysR family transcriptional regulator [Salipiger abyssi]|uniref:LysR family transcriptional regulator, glycine cleavage system transcriptional activator n=1 Tax=Salipiger abyssi TaxID=1250539 RepID=A0A1P8UM19_9RHOB|nr:LysR family transcriptional regulator [Salipiger abyssi]APZ50439.1 LysR family transcriptional regulator, glycine cleavage system transcriptional activator [Salipiger abyssi]